MVYNVGYDQAGETNSLWQSTVITTFNKRGENAHPLEGGGTIAIRERWNETTTRKGYDEDRTNGYRYEDHSHTQNIAYRRSDTAVGTANPGVSYLAEETRSGKGDILLLWVFAGSAAWVQGGFGAGSQWAEPLFVVSWAT